LSIPITSCSRAPGSRWVNCTDGMKSICSTLWRWNSWNEK
jgi:hypothetical protein